MNILPKKRWHVRTKDNIARVRRDEAAAREQEELQQKKAEFAESEARINFLRTKSGIPTRQSESGSGKDCQAVSSSCGQHVDLFSDYKAHIRQTNKDLEKEKKDEQDKYEKQIGYLTYLGQDTNEALKLRSWYEVAPKRAAVEEHNPVEKDLKSKCLHDPLTLLNVLLPADKPTTSKSSLTPSAKQTVFQDSKSPNITQTRDEKSSSKAHKEKKHKKHKKHTSSKSRKREKDRKKHLLAEDLKPRMNKADLEKLRQQRIRREAAERLRQDSLLAPQPVAEDTSHTKEIPTPRIVQKYNSQFNPELAKQNMA